MGRKWHAVAVLAITYIVTTTAVAANDKGLSFAGTAAAAPEEASSLGKLASLDGTTHQHVWPPLNAGWRTVLGSFVGFFGAALGSIGGLGGGAIFVPMLTLIVGFDTKSATAMSKCDGIEYAPPAGSDAVAETRPPSDKAVSIWKNIYWKEFGLLIFVWAAILTLQVAMNYVETCSTLYWVFSLLQIPVSAGVSIYQAVGLVQGKRVISSRANTQTSLKSHLVLICFFGVTAGVLGGLLGIGGGVIMGPLFLELGIPPQVSSATATFAMMFSSSIAVIEYYLLNRFPIPYALFFTCVAFIAAIVGQLVARKLINWLGRASFIIFVLSFMIFIGVIPLGGVGILNMKHKMVQHEYMGFHDICMSDA
uniref:Sulfite exporter TauE/SafE family protein n=1 Tax=Aegilops tauschii subsp. strangulata TaxID=200361 RepID=A0A453GUW7_AEGTS